MPTTATKQKPTSKLNPTVGVAFTNPKFGKNSIKGKPISQEDYDTLMKSIRVGSSFLIKQTGESKFGGYQYHIEILPPWDKNEARVATSTTQSESEID